MTLPVALAVELTAAPAELAALPVALVAELTPAWALAAALLALLVTALVVAFTVAAASVPAFGLANDTVANRAAAVVVSRRVFLFMMGGEIRVIDDARRSRCGPVWLRNPYSINHASG